MERLSLDTALPKQFVDITALLAKCVERNRWTTGVLVVFVPHTSAGITVNENSDPAVPRDILTHLQYLVPRKGEYRHQEGNSDAHILSLLCGVSLQLLVEEGSLQLGTWQSVFFCEFDGPRRREVWAQFIAGENSKEKVKI